MAEYHFTDQLGQAVTGAKKAALEAADQLTALDEELTAERESHRAEKLRLVERAEAAELERDQLERYEERAHTAEQRLAALEGQLAGARRVLSTSEDPEVQRDAARFVLGL